MSLQPCFKGFRLKRDEQIDRIGKIQTAKVKQIGKILTVGNSRGRLHGCFFTQSFQLLCGLKNSEVEGKVHQGRLYLNRKASPWGEM